MLESANKVLLTFESQHSIGGKGYGKHSIGLCAVVGTSREKKEH